MTHSHLLPCPSCARHVRAPAPSCPFCQSALSEGRLRTLPPAAPRIRLSRGALVAFGASAVALATAACGGVTVSAEDGGSSDGQASTEGASADGAPAPADVAPSDAALEDGGAPVPAARHGLRWPAAVLAMSGFREIHSHDKHVLAAAAAFRPHGSRRPPVTFGALGASGRQDTWAEIHPPRARLTATTRAATTRCLMISRHGGTRRRRERT